MVALTARLAEATRRVGELGDAGEARRADAAEKRAAEAESALEEAAKQVRIHSHSPIRRMQMLCSLP